jgi:hypothetical protein
MSKPKRQSKTKRGPAKGQGGRPPGPKRINLGTVRVLEATASWLESRGQTAAQALDDLSGSNVQSVAQSHDR